MKIHTFQQGDSLYSIAQKYGTTVDRLETDNSITRNTNLSIGQAVLISEPEQTYVVQEGDTVTSITEMFGVPFTQILRYNPFITLRENFTLYPGEELVIKYNIKDRAIQVNGFTTTYVSSDVLKETLPSLTYLTILGHRVTATGELEEANDDDIINSSLIYKAAPIVFISAIDAYGKGSYEITHSILTNEDIQNTFINNIFSLMKTHGYYGANIGFYYVFENDLPQYIECIKQISQRAKDEGYLLFVTCFPETFKFDPNTPYPYSYFNEIGMVADYVILTSFLWPSSTMEQVALTTPYYEKQYLEFVITQIPSIKIFIGYSRVAYDWELPYVVNESKVSSLTNTAAVNQANQLLVPIQFDETTQTPYYNYTNAGIEHFVWYKDFRTINALTNLIDDYNLVGISIWNISYYFTQTWNAQYNILDFETNIK